MQNEELEQISLQLVHQFTGIDTTWAQLEKQLEHYLLYLLEKDLPKLYQLLYRIDVSETKVRALFGGESHDIAHDLCQLVLQRIIIKAELRLKYRN